MSVGESIAAQIADIDLVDIQLSAFSRFEPEIVKALVRAVADEHGGFITSFEDAAFMAEFFVLKAYRRQGVGASAFSKIVERHHGPWQVGVIDKNGGAGAFRMKVVKPYSPSSLTHHFDGEDWVIYEFEVA